MEEYVKISLERFKELDSKAAEAKELSGKLDAVGRIAIKNFAKIVEASGIEIEITEGTRVLLDDIICSISPNNARKIIVTKKQ